MRLGADCPPIVNDALVSRGCQLPHPPRGDILTDMKAQEIGRIAALYRYPVKSMGAESLESINVGWHGFTGDRRWAFVREGLVRSNFPWLTIRENPEMWHYQPRFVEPDRPEHSPVSVHTPSGVDFDVADPALAAMLGHGAQLIKQGRGVFDTFPLSLISVQTVAAIGEMTTSVLNALRFRPNLVIDARDANDFPEDELVGSVLQIGEMKMRIDKRDERCVMINVDPSTTEKNAGVLRAVAQERQACAGVYGSTVQTGRVAVGDKVFVAR